MQATIKLTQFSQKLYKCSQDWINKTYMRITGFTWSLLDPCPKKNPWYWAAKISTIKTQIGH